MPWFGIEHLAGILAVLLSCLTVGWIARLRPAASSWINRFLVLNLLAYIVLAYAVRWNDLTWATGLPLHLCDLLVVGALALLLGKGRGRGRQLIYDCVLLWTWSGSIWALITPDLPVGFPHYRYFEFFWGHGLLFVVLSQLRHAHGLCLTPHSWRSAALGLQLWLLTVGFLDWLFGWNYGYLMHRPPGGSPLDYFGPWPCYIVVADVLAVLAFFLTCRLLGAVPEAQAPTPLG